MLMVLGSTAKLTHSLYPGSAGDVLSGLVGVGYFFVWLPMRWWRG